jgi:hypothetical protein
MYKILSDILLSIPQVEEILGDHQRGFRRKRSYILRQKLEKKWAYNDVVYQLFIDFKKVYELIRKEILNNIPTEFGIAKKLVKLIKMCLNETCSRVRVGKNLSDMFPIKNDLKQDV